MYDVLTSRQTSSGLFPPAPSQKLPRPKNGATEKSSKLGKHGTVYVRTPVLRMLIVGLEGTRTGGKRVEEIFSHDHIILSPSD